MIHELCEVHIYCDPAFFKSEHHYSISLSKDMRKKIKMIKEKGHVSREGVGAFMSNTNYMKKKSTMIKGEGTWY